MGSVLHVSSEAHTRDFEQDVGKRRGGRSNPSDITSMHTPTLLLMSNTEGGTSVYMGARDLERYITTSIIHSLYEHPHAAVITTLDNDREMTGSCGHACLHKSRCKEDSVSCR